MGNDLPVETREYVVTGMILLDNRLIDGLFTRVNRKTTKIVFFIRCASSRCVSMVKHPRQEEVLPWFSVVRSIFS